jgi:hypothetical protein
VAVELLQRKTSCSLYAHVLNKIITAERTFSSADFSCLWVASWSSFWATHSHLLSSHPLELSGSLSLQRCNHFITLMVLMRLLESPHPQD